MTRMGRTRNRLAALVAVGVLAAVGGGCAATEPYAAVADGVRIDEDAFLRELAVYRANPQLAGGTEVGAKAPASYSAEFAASALTNDIYLDVILPRAAKKLGVEVTKADIESQRDQVLADPQVAGLVEDIPEWFLDDVFRRAALRRAVMAKLTSRVVPEGDVEAFYEANKDRFRQRCAHHILVGTQEESVAVVGRLGSGEQFEEVAAQVSIDQQSAQKGGDLGCVAAGRLIPDFEAALDTLRPGEVSAPVKTQFGYHVIRLDRVVAPSLEEVRAEIVTQLGGDPDQLFGDFLGQVSRMAKVKVNPRFGRWRPQQAGIAVVAPPAAPDQTGEEETAPAEPAQDLPAGPLVPGAGQGTQQAPPQGTQQAPPQGTQQAPQQAPPPGP